jgi:formate hydrogenlyase transcriptional activator
MTANLSEHFHRKRRYALRGLILLLTAALSSFRLLSAEADSVRSVLVLVMGEGGLPAGTLFLGGFRTTLLADTSLDIDVSAEHVALSPLPTKREQDKFVEYLRAKYHGQGFDLVVAWGSEPLRFLVENRNTLWPRAKAIGCVLGSPDTTLVIPPDVTFMNVALDFSGTVGAIHSLHPSIRHIALVGGYAAEDLRDLELAREACRTGIPGVTIIDPSGQIPQEIMRGLAILPDQTAVILSAFTADARGRPVVGADWVPLAVKFSRSPMYSVFSNLLGHGIVGGSLTSFEELGAEVARKALGVLHGESLSGVQTGRSPFRNFVFDWRELNRWGVSESQLPPGSDVRFRTPSFWNEYRWYIIGTFSLLLIFGFSTTGLAIERRQRKRAQNELREQLKLATLVADLSLPLIKALPARLVEEIAQGLRQIADFLGFDRGTYFEIAPSSNILKVTASAGKPGIPMYTPGEDIVLPWAADRLRRGEPLVFNVPAHPLPDDAKEEQDFVRRTGLQSVLMIPLETASGSLEVLSFGAFHNSVVWSPEFITRLTIIGRVFSGLIADSRTETQLRNALDEVTALKQKLEVENVYLRESTDAQTRQEEIVGKSKAMKSVLAAIERVAPTDSTVLILGETGTGKELVANAIHRLSKHGSRPMVKLNCAALPPSLIEAELFGREKGAFTGALSRQAGRFELANGSTILLDEIGELTPDLQVKLLRVLQNGEFQRVGGTQTINVNVRVIAATNRDISAAVQAGTFREDLFYRLNVFPISIPPLRERKEDIPLLAWAFAKELGEAFGKPIERIPQETMDSFLRYSWPGNIRELRNVIERALILGDTSTLRVNLSPTLEKTVPPRETIDESERRLIIEALERSDWRIRGIGGAAELLGLKASTLEYRIKRHGLKRRH